MIKVGVKNESHKYLEMEVVFLTWNYRVMIIFRIKTNSAIY
jgi:hypothetical protein